MALDARAQLERAIELRAGEVHAPETPELREVGRLVLGRACDLERPRKGALHLRRRVAPGRHAHGAERALQRVLLAIALRRGGEVAEQREPLLEVDLGFGEGVAPCRGLGGHAPIAGGARAIAALLEVQGQLGPELGCALPVRQLERVSDPPMGLGSPARRHRRGERLAIERVAEGEALGHRAVGPRPRFPADGETGPRSAKSLAALLDLGRAAVRAGGRGRGGELHADEARGFEELRGPPHPGARAAARSRGAGFRARRRAARGIPSPRASARRAPTIAPCARR